MNLLLIRLRQRCARSPLAGFAGAALACAWLVAVLALFDTASSDDWLADTPDNRARAGHCQQLPGRADRVDCMQQLQIAAARNGDRSSQVVAQAASAADSTR